VHDFAARIHSVIDTLDDIQKQQLLRLLIEDVRVTGWHVQIRLRIALDPPPRPTDPPHPTGPTGPTGKPSPPRPRPVSVSTQDGLRSVGEALMRRLPATYLRRSDVMTVAGWMGLARLKMANRLPIQRFPYQEVPHRWFRERRDSVAGWISYR
jgi:hypothetical protein